MRSDYGKKGGTSATAGKKAVSFATLAPDGTELKRRFFDLPDIEDDMVAALLAPRNGHPWIFWEVAASEDAMPDYVKRGRANDPTDVVITRARRLT